MPDERKGINPSQGFLGRIFGTAPMTPEMEQGIQIARQENPNLAPVESFGFLSRLMRPNIQGYASPGRSIYLNPNVMRGMNPQDVADTITHEQEHINQMRSRGLSPSMEFLRGFSNPFQRNDPYHQRPDEMAAFQAERLRRSRMGRPETGYPSFITGQGIAPQNIYLPRGR